MGRVTEKRRYKMSSSPLLLGFLIIGASVAQDMSSDMSSDYLVWSSGYGSDRSGMGSDFYDYYGSEYGSEFLEEFEAEYGPEFWEALESEYGSEYLGDFEYAYGSGFDYADYYGSEVPSGRSLTEDDRAEGLNNCSGKKNGSPCKKRCSSQACEGQVLGEYLPDC